MTLIRRWLRILNILEAQQNLIQSQQKLIEDQNHELRRLHLEHVREMHGVVSSWRIHMETPEIDLRDEVDALAATLGERAAILEEHVV